MPSQPLRAGLDKTRPPGFTLVELVIVALIVGIIAAIAVPRFADSLSYYRVDAAATRIRADLRLARQEAKSSGAIRSLMFSINPPSYELSDVEHLDHASWLYKVDLSEPPYLAELVSVDFGGDLQVDFDRFGTADTDGQIIVAAGGYQRTITLTTATGEIVVTE